MIIAATLAVAVGIGAGVGFAYVALRSELLENVDQQLSHQGTGLASFARHANAVALKQGKNPKTAQTIRKWTGYSRGFGDALAVSQFVYSNGHTMAGPFPSSSASQIPQNLPVNQTDLAVANGSTTNAYVTVEIAGTPVRIYTSRVAAGEAVQVALPLTAVDNELKELGIELGLAGLVGIAVAAALGWWVTRTALRPVAQLTEAAELIAAEPRELTHRIELGKRADQDELGRLAVSFNAMLAAVQDLTKKQRQLVADASHELRTPLTSLRMNAEVLDKFDRLDDVDRKRVINSLLSGIDELTGLVADTMELARGEEREVDVAPLQWDEVTEHVVERAICHWPQMEFRLNVEPCTVYGVADRLERAVGNLVNNAAKFSGGEGAVDICLTEHGKLTVRDHGPGIPEEDLPHVFNRFYRSAEMRDQPGSGLGLAIVAQVAEAHGGSVTAENAQPGPGALFTLEIPAED